MEETLDLSPSGYRDWRKGHERETWRKIAEQLSSGQPGLPTKNIGLPLESLLLGPLPYDFQESDIPVRFIGKGKIATSLEADPAIFNVPSRREVEKVLKSFGHVLYAAGGKGGHQKWVGPDRRTFALPTADPISRTVFKHLLHYLSIDKQTYINKVRQNL